MFCLPYHQYVHKKKAHVETFLRSEAQNEKKKNARGAERNVLNESELIPEQTVCTNDVLSLDYLPHPPPPPLKKPCLLCVLCEMKEQKGQGQISTPADTKNKSFVTFFTAEM